MDALVDDEMAPGHKRPDVTRRIDLERALARLRPPERLSVVLAYAVWMSHGELVRVTTAASGDQIRRYRIRELPRHAHDVQGNELADVIEASTAVPAEALVGPLVADRRTVNVHPRLASRRGRRSRSMEWWNSKPTSSVTCGSPGAWRTAARSPPRSTRRGSR